MVMRQDASTGEMVDDGQQPAIKSTADGQEIMDIKVYSPFKVYFEGEAFSVSAASTTGDFDILPRHHNFITLLTTCDLTVRSSSGDQTFGITGGIMHVKADKVIVFLDV